jgi:hypothetical protein
MRLRRCVSRGFDDSIFADTVGSYHSMSADEAVGYEADTLIRLIRVKTLTQSPPFLQRLSCGGHAVVISSASFERIRMKISVIGGGSTYTPELVNGFLARLETLPVTELWLMDIDPARLDIVGGFAKRR